MKPINLLEIEKAATPAREEAEGIEQFARGWSLREHTDLEKSAQIIAEIKEQAEKIDGVRRKFTTPLRDVISEINGFFEPALSALGNAEEVIKTHVVLYLDKCTRERGEALALVESTPEDKRGALLSRAEASVPPKVAGMSVRENWTGEVTDTEAVIRWAVENNRHDVLTVNSKALVALTKAMGRDPIIPGWSAHCDHSIAVTVGKVKK